MSNGIPSALDGFDEADAEASAVEVMVGEIVAYNPALIRNTRSEIRPEDVQTDGLMLIDILVDTSQSMVDQDAPDGIGPMVPLQLLGHDWYIQSLLPAAAKGVTILVSCTGLNGHVYYRFTPIEDVPLFGNKPQPWDTEKPRPSTGLIYNEATRKFVGGMSGGTPLRDRMIEMAVASLEESKRWRVGGRIAQVVNLALTDGLDLHSAHTIEETRTFFDDLTENGSFTEQMMLMMECPEPGEPGYDKALRDLLAYYSQKSIPLPQGAENMTAKQLLDALFAGIVAPANLLPVGGDPKKVRHVLGFFSRVADKLSRVAGGDSDQ